MLDKNISLKFEIKNKRLFIQQVAAGAFIVSVIAIFVWQIQNAGALKHTLEQKKAKLKEAKATSKHLKKLEIHALDLEKKEKAINKMIARDEKNPFGLIKSLTAFAEEIGLHNTSFKMKEAKEPAAADTLGAQPEATVTLEEGIATQEAASAAHPNEPYGSSMQSGIIPTSFEMRFEGSYLQLLKLLEKMYAFERIITVEGITIERKKELVPYQKFTLHLTIYSFPKE